MANWGIAVELGREPCDTVGAITGRALMCARVRRSMGVRDRGGHGCVVYSMRGRSM